MPLVFLIAAPVIFLVVSFLIKERKHLEILSFVVSAAESSAAFWAIARVLSSSAPYASRFFYIDSLSALLMLIISVIGFLVNWYSLGYLREEVAKGIIGFRRVRQFYILFHLFLLAMFLAVISKNPVVMWVAIEATTLATAFLVSFYAQSKNIEAAWKYLIINSIGLLLGFFGTILFLSSIPALAGNGHFGWEEIRNSARAMNPSIIKIAFIFIFIGYGTKVGLAPMHTWLPDAHGKAPVPVSALLSGVLLNVAFFAILRFKGIADIVLGSGYSQTLLIFFGALSVGISSFIFYVQKNYKRMLAYSSIEHMGIIALGVGFGGAAASAAMLHMVYHAVTKSLLFLCSGNIFVKYSSTKIQNVQGLITLMPKTAIIFFLGFLSIMGIPPFGIFLTKFLILSDGIKTHPFAAIVVLFALGFIFVGFFRQVMSMVFGKPPEGIQKGESSNFMLYPIYLLLAILFAISFFIPKFLQEIISHIVL